MRFCMYALIARYRLHMERIPKQLRLFCFGHTPFRQRARRNSRHDAALDENGAHVSWEQRALGAKVVARTDPATNHIWRRGPTLPCDRRPWCAWMSLFELFEFAFDIANCFVCQWNMFATPLVCVGELV